MYHVAILLAVAAIMGAPIALLFAWNGAGGVIIGGCCLLAILARLAQAADQHGELKQMLADRTDALRRY
jgi:hypothetical protein